MGCIKSKEEKGSAMKYCPDGSTTAAANSAAAASQMGHYGPDPTQLQNQVPASSSGNVGVNFNHTVAPFGGSSSAMTPFGGVSSSFTGPVSNSFSGAVSSEFPMKAWAVKCPWVLNNDAGILYSATVDLHTHTHTRMKIDGASERPFLLYMRQNNPPVGCF